MISLGALTISKLALSLNTERVSLKVSNVGKETMIGPAVMFADCCQGQEA